MHETLQLLSAGPRHQASARTSAESDEACQRKTKDRADGMREKSAYSPRRDSNLYLWDSRPLYFRLHHEGVCACVRARACVCVCVCARACTLYMCCTWVSPGLLISILFLFIWFSIPSGKSLAMSIFSCDKTLCFSLSLGALSRQESSWRRVFQEVSSFPQARFILCSLFSSDIKSECAHFFVCLLSCWPSFP